MKIDAAQYTDMHGVMQSRGLPKSLLRARGEVSRRDLLPCRHAESKSVMPDRQARLLEQSMMRPTGDWLLVAGTRRDQDLLALVGLEFFARATRANLVDPARFYRPLWHQVTNGWNDRLRGDSKEDVAWRTEQLPIGALVLSGITTDCPTNKLEKVRDLLLMYEGIPRFVLVSGDADPLAFCMDQLNRRPDRVVRLGRTAARARSEGG